MEVRDWGEKNLHGFSKVPVRTKDPTSKQIRQRGRRVGSTKTLNPLS